MLSSESFHNASKPRLSEPRQRPEAFAAPLNSCCETQT
jgi:hypothetical protein